MRLCLHPSYSAHVFFSSGPTRPSLLPSSSGSSSSSFNRSRSPPRSLFPQGQINLLSVVHTNVGYLFRQAPSFLTSPVTTFHISSSCFPLAFHQVRSDNLQTATLSFLSPASMKWGFEKKSWVLFCFTEPTPSALTHL